jgi:GPI mannosyltransferase 3
VWSSDPAATQPGDERRFKLTLLAAAAAALALRVWVGFRYDSLAWPDEIFQTLEQGHRLAFGYGIIPWEFRDGIRSWLLPGVLAAVMKLTAPLGAGSAGYVGGVTVFLAALGALPAVIAMLWIRAAGFRAQWLAAVPAVFWFELVYLSQKALTEVIAAWALGVALLLTVPLGESGSRRTSFWAGAAWGVVLGLRFHLALAAAVAVLWTTRNDRRRLLAMTAGGAVSLGLFGLLDWVTWGTPFQSIWKNFWVNVVQAKAAWFGVSAWWEYLVSINDVWSIGMVPLLAAALVGCRKWPVLAITAVTILVSHMMLGHKEYRFLAPFLAVVVLAAGLGLCIVWNQSKAVAGVVAGAILAASAWGATRYDWRHLAPRPRGFPPSPMWSFREGQIRAYRFLSTDPNVCGVASLGVLWAWTGGYTYLHRAIPFFSLNNAQDLVQYSSGFNTIVGAQGYRDYLPGFTPGPCWGDVCVFQRPGTCDLQGYDINAWIAERGM